MRLGHQSRSVFDNQFERFFLFSHDLDIAGNTVSSDQAYDSTVVGDDDPPFVFLDHHLQGSRDIVLEGELQPSLMGD